MMTSLIPIRRLDEIFDTLCDSGACAEGRTEAAVRMLPRADILEGEKEYRLVMDLPGVERDAVHVELEDQTLLVRATREEKLPEGFKVLRGERAGLVEFRRTFTLGKGVDAAGIAARLDRGVLVVSLPKAEHVLPRRIEIK